MSFINSKLIYLIESCIVIEILAGDFEDDYNAISMQYVKGMVVYIEFANQYFFQRNFFYYELMCV